MTAFVKAAPVRSRAANWTLPRGWARALVLPPAPPIDARGSSSAACGTRPRIGPGPTAAGRRRGRACRRPRSPRSARSSARRCARASRSRTLLPPFLVAGAPRVRRGGRPTSPRPPPAVRRRPGRCAATSGIRGRAPSVLFLFYWPRPVISSWPHTLGFLLGNSGEILQGPCHAATALRPLRLDRCVAQTGPIPKYLSSDWRLKA